MRPGAPGVPRPPISSGEQLGDPLEQRASAIVRRAIDGSCTNKMNSRRAPAGGHPSKARLREVREHLPDGLATELGEGGGIVSGGEGQRTRVGRALARKRARLVILDEPFRGLDLGPAESSWRWRGSGGATRPSCG
jgi:ATPase subunit of ABC transporter with duplicated ATPase domains